MFLAADYGYDSYSTTIETTRGLIDKNPDLVQRSVDASIIGWYNYIYDDNRAANALIKRDNPDIGDDQLAYSVAKMKEYGIVNSGDSVDARDRRHARRKGQELFCQDGGSGAFQAGPRL